jgi:hypothetical protein
MHHRTPCMYGADDRARRLQTHRTPCTCHADDRARISVTHRTPCTESADVRADKRCTPCTPSASSPRARTARRCLGAYFRFVPFLVDSSLDVSVFSASPTSGTCYPDSRPPNRRHPHPRGGRPEVMIRCCLSRRPKLLQFQVKSRPYLAEGAQSVPESRKVRRDGSRIRHASQRGWVRVRGASPPPTLKPPAAPDRRTRPRIRPRNFADQIPNPAPTRLTRRLRACRR